MEAYLLRPNRRACLVLQSTNKKGCEALIAAVKKTGGVVLEFPTPTEAELPRWLQEQAFLRQKQLSLQAATLLGGAFWSRSASAWQAKSEKLCDFVGERNRIEPPDVDQVVCHQRQYTIFELVRSVGKCQAGRAITILRQLLLAGEAPLSILGLLARHFRILWQVKDGLRMGLTVDSHRPENQTVVVGAQKGIPPECGTIFDSDAFSSTPHCGGNGPGAENLAGVLLKRYWRLWC